MYVGTDAFPLKFLLGQVVTCLLSHFATPWTVARQASLSMGFSRLEWVAIHLPRSEYIWNARCIYISALKQHWKNLCCRNFCWNFLWWYLYVGIPASGEIVLTRFYLCVYTLHTKALWVSAKLLALSVWMGYSSLHSSPIGSILKIHLKMLSLWNLLVNLSTSSLNSSSLA